MIYMFIEIRCMIDIVYIAVSMFTTPSFKFLMLLLSPVYLVSAAAYDYVFHMKID